jgi:hypothetical protein
MAVGQQEIEEHDLERRPLKPFQACGQAIG